MDVELGPDAEFKHAGVFDFNFNHTCRSYGLRNRGKN